MRPVHDFTYLTQMRPRLCAGLPASDFSTPDWQGNGALCAWRDRISMRSWTARTPDAEPCVSPAAVWWRRVQEQAAAVPVAVWDRTWLAQRIAFDADGILHLATIERGVDGQWTAREWRWNPSDRAATRRWQQGRWDLLLAASMALRPEPAGRAAPQWQGAITAAWMQSIGRAPAEIVGDQWRWSAAGRCLYIDSVGVSEGGLQVPYQIEDSRLEQRSAMQVLLARRHPGAVWLKTFSLLDDTPKRKDGSARFFAVWREQDTVRGQLWIPTRKNGPVHQLRLSTQLLPAGMDGAGAAAAAQAVEQALRRINQLLGTVDG